MTATLSPAFVDDAEAQLTESTASGVLLEHIRAEFEEMPGLILTPRQAARLWTVTASQAEALLSELMTDGFLVRDPRGSYRRRRCPRCS